MNRALVVVEPSEEGRRLVEIAADFAEGSGAELLLVRIIDEDDYRGDLQRKARSSQADVDDVDDVEERARLTAEDIGGDVLADRGVSHEARGLVGSVPRDLLETARESGCDHLFITGDRRSPTGKAIFGDTAQALLLNFDGPVTSLIGQP